MISERRTFFSVLRALFRRRLALAFYLVVFCLGWNFLDHIRLRGLVEGITTKETNPLQRVENILDWIEHRSQVTSGGYNEESRNVFKTMQSHASLSSEANASFLFVNLCKASDLKARRLILVNSNYTAMHVAAEVWLNGEWAVVEPAYFTLLRDDAGNLLTRKQLVDKAILKRAVAELKNYPSYFSFADAIHVRISKMGIAGRWARKTLDRSFPDWEDFCYPLIGLLDLNSTAFLAASFILLLICVPWSPKLKVRPFLFFQNNIEEKTDLRGA